MPCSWSARGVTNHAPVPCYLFLPQIYRGDDLSYTVQSLEPNCEYQFRVCAIRIPADNSTDLPGPYSVWATYQTTSNRKDEGSSESGGEGRSLSGGELERISLGEQQVAAIIMAVVLVCAIVIAIILQYLVS